MLYEAHFKLQIFGSMKPEVFTRFVQILGLVHVDLEFPFTSIEEMLLQSDQSFLDFYDISWDELQEHVLCFLVQNDVSFVLLGHPTYDMISFSAGSRKLAVAGYNRGALCSEQIVSERNKQSIPELSLVA